MFAVVKFSESNQVAVVSSSWICGNICYWPSHYDTDSAVQNVVKIHQLPDFKTWEACPSKTLHKYGTYEKARLHIPAAERGSDLSDGETLKHGKRKIRKKLFHGFSPSGPVHKKPTQTKDSQNQNGVTKVTVAGEENPDKMNSASESEQSPGYSKIRSGLMDNVSNSCPRPSTSQENVEFVTNAPWDNVFGNNSPFNVQAYQQVENVNESFLILDGTTGATYTQDSAAQPTGALNMGAPNESRDFAFAEMSQFEFQKYVVRTLEDIKFRLEQIEQRQKREAISLIQDIPKPSNYPKIPIQSVHELKKFDRDLKNDSALREFTVKEFSAVGGKDPKDATKCIFEELVLDEVASRYSWKGKREKLDFSLLCFDRIIFDAIRLNKELSKTVNKGLVKSKIQNLLKYAPTRVRRKMGGQVEDIEDSDVDDGELSENDQHSDDE